MASVEYDAAKTAYLAPGGTRADLIGVGDKAFLRDGARRIASFNTEALEQMRRDFLSAFRLGPEAKTISGSVQWLYPKAS